MIAEVSQSSYYYIYIVIFVLILGMVQLLIWAFRPKEEHHDLHEHEVHLLTNEDFQQKGGKLKIIYMVAYLLARSSMWAKAPYTYMLFSTYHKLDVGQIGIVY